MSTPLTFSTDLIFEEGLKCFEVEFKEVNTVTVGAIPYTGDYVVTPKVDEQILPTENKLMEDDVTIKAIPFYNVSNTAGGSTVYIGKELE